MKHPYDDQATVADLQRVLEYAGKLGLHGIIILSPKCPSCGACHQWNMLTDLGGDDADATSTVRQLLLYHVDKVGERAPKYLSEPRPDA